jgi:predicted N-acetyltransferase YhbS
VKAFHIVPLSMALQHVETVTEWLTNAFGTDNSRPFFAAILRASLSEAEFPLTWVALEGDRVAGTVGLWRCDLISRQDLFPWLAALYVDESYRGEGLSEQLQQTVIAECRLRGYPTLYLYSECADYYERFGWRYIGDALDYPDKSVRLYHRHL